MGHRSVFIVDDHPLVVDGLRAIIGGTDDLRVVGYSSFGHDALSQIGMLLPDIVVVDLGLPDMSGEAVIDRIKSGWKAIRILVVTAEQNRERLKAIALGGVDGIIGKSAVSNDLVKAIRDVADGGTFFEVPTSPHPNAIDRHQAEANLSDRETEVLRLVARGLATKQIAADLGISPKTIETHKARALVKLGLFSRSDIFTFAQKQGWLQ